LSVIIQLVPIIGEPLLVLFWKFWLFAHLYAPCYDVRTHMP
jgi:hypothetical protein